MTATPKALTLILFAMATSCASDTSFDELDEFSDATPFLCEGPSQTRPIQLSSESPFLNKNAGESIKELMSTSNSSNCSVYYIFTGVSTNDNEPFSGSSSVDFECDYATFENKLIEIFETNNNVRGVSFKIESTQNDKNNKVVQSIYLSDSEENNSPEHIKSLATVTGHSSSKFTYDDSGRQINSVWRIEGYEDGQNLVLDGGSKATEYNEFEFNGIDCLETTITRSEYKDSLDDNNQPSKEGDGILDSVETVTVSSGYNICRESVPTDCKAE